MPSARAASRLTLSKPCWRDAKSIGRKRSSIFPASVPPPGFLKTLPNLKALFSLGAGVDGFLRDPEFPRHLPLVRFVDPTLMHEMAQYVVMHVLIAHRGQRFFDAAQQESAWRQRMLARPSRDTSIGILGLGDIGGTIATSLLPFDFQLSGWSRSRKHIAGVKSFAGRRRIAAIPGAMRLLRLRVADDRRHQRHHERRIVRPASPGRLGDQCGAGRSSDRRGFDRGAGLRPPGRRGSGRLSNRTPAAGKPDLAASQDHRDAAYRRHHRLAGSARLCRRLREAVRKAANRSKTWSI